MPLSPFPSSSGFNLTGSTGSSFTLTNGITVDAGVTDATISTAVTANVPITVAVADPDASLAISGVLSGTGSLTKTGDGTLSLTTDARTGGRTVSSGTLLIGSLPSVFTDDLTSTVTFSTTRPDALLAANPGMSGGSFDLTVLGLTDGSLVLGGDGNMGWTPQNYCQPDTYPALATYTYNTGGV
jgi:fibronectin-binding autotransporter adhesin